MADRGQGNDSHDQRQPLPRPLEITFSGRLSTPADILDHFKSSSKPDQNGDLGSDNSGRPCQRFYLSSFREFMVCTETLSKGRVSRGQGYPGTATKDTRIDRWWFLKISQPDSKALTSFPGPEIGAVWPLKLFSA